MSQPLAVAQTEKERPRDLELFVLDAVKIQAWDRLLVVGCGDGWIVEEAWRRAVRAYARGVDTSPELVARATELRSVPGKLDFATWDGRRLPCEDSSFHRVIGLFALRPPLGPAGVLAEIHRVLEPRGHLYLVEIDRRADDDDATPPAYGAALHRTGFCEIQELDRRGVAVEGGERATGAIVHARA
jgi:ubiquinone/menaquinone biosynthesis C-methylase UbiE